MVVADASRSTQKMVQTFPNKPLCSHLNAPAPPHLPPCCQRARQSLQEILQPSQDLLRQSTDVLQFPTDVPPRSRTSSRTRRTSRSSSRTSGDRSWTSGCHPGTSRKGCRISCNHSRSSCNHCLTPLPKPINPRKSFTGAGFQRFAAFRPRSKHVPTHNQSEEKHHAQELLPAQR